MVLAQIRQEDQCIRIEYSDINPHNYSHLSSTKKPKTQDGEKTVSSTNFDGKTGYPHMED
jgi:hypothetical protein